ncbi:MAG: 2-polyprenyl-3-methyl-5-hydroxy-6-metoxy-1,4-benzoquinol methylase [Salibacteraceae bacterium]|jgi:2-polyprenyl-3-methyl-5-hydroxy-6-metoxy-1,4-benzoquinol methylase
MGVIPKMFLNTKYRSKKTEIMDDLNMSGDLLIKSLDQLALINKWLGGNSVTINGVTALLKNQNPKKEISICDLGCGNGDMLIKVAKFGRKNGFKLRLIGIDANQTTIDYAKKLSEGFPEISYEKQDVLSLDFQNRKFDIGLCTLFLHHFEDSVALDFLQKLQNQSTIGLVINDLHRHKLAYFLFWIVATIIGNPMIKTDGLISILKGFKRKELETYAQQLNFKSSLIWRWAFRYEWIIRK